MKNFLVPTDFSHCAANAVRVAAQLAQRFEGTVHFLYCLPPSEEGSSRPERREVDDEPQQRRRYARGQLEELQKRYQKIPTEIALVKGNLRDRIAEYVQDHGTDLIVMGSHGSSGKNEYFIGSHTQKVVRTVHCPVLVIKEPPESIDFKKVVFASNFNEEEKKSFRYFKDFIKHFLPEIHLVAVHTSSLFDPPYIVSKEAMEDFKKLCSPFACKTHVYKDLTIDRGIRSFADDISADLIAISNHNRHPLKRMFSGSNVEALVNHSHIPVLSIDYVEPET